MASAKLFRCCRSAAITDTLKNEVKSGKIAHAIYFAVQEVQVKLLPQKFYQGNDKLIIYFQMVILAINAKAVREL